MEIFTSIKPPTNPGNVSYLRDCLNSSVAAGFDPVTVNRPREIETLSKLDLPARFSALPADGKPRIGAILSVIRKTGARFAGIINADCKLVGYSGIAGRLEAGLDGRIALAWRLDDHNGQFSASPYGLDAFFFDTRYLPPDDLGFNIGDAWWDIWSPLACEAQGAIVEALKTPLLTHKVRPFNCNWDQYDENGRRLCAAFGKPGIPSHAEVEKWERSLADKLNARLQTISFALGSAMLTKAKRESREAIAAKTQEQVRPRAELKAVLAEPATTAIIIDPAFHNYIGNHFTSVAGWCEAAQAGALNVRVLARKECVAETVGEVPVEKIFNGSFYQAAPTDSREAWKQCQTSSRWTGQRASDSSAVTAVVVSRRM